MSARATSAGFLSLTAFLLTSLFPGSGLTEPASGKGSLTNPFYIQPRTGAQHIGIGQWMGALFSRCGHCQPGRVKRPSKWIPAQVPGSVQVSLFKAGELPDPYIRLNAKKYDWVLGKTWYYRKSFVSSGVRQRSVCVPVLRRRRLLLQDLVERP